MCSNSENQIIHAQCQSLRAPTEIRLLLAVGSEEGFRLENTEKQKQTQKESKIKEKESPPNLLNWEN